MSSSAGASFPSSSAEKGLSNFAQSYDDLNNDFFDQFLTFDNNNNNTPAVNHETPDYSILPTHFEDGPIDGGLSGAASLSFLDDNVGLDIGVDLNLDLDFGLKDLANVQGGSFAIFDNAASFNADLGNYFYTEATDRAAVSDPELLSLENISLDSPHIPQVPQTSPSSPTTNNGPFLLKKNRIADSTTRTLRRVTGSVDRNLSRSPIKKVSSSRVLRTHHSNSSQEFWEQKLSQESVNLNFNFDAPLSPPPSAQTSDASDNSIKSEKRNDSLAIFASVPQSTPNLEYETPMATPTLEQHQTPHSSNLQISSSSPFPPTPHTNNVSGSWSQVPSGNSQPYPKLNSFPEIDDPIWWNHAATAPLAQPTPSGYHTNPQRATKSLVAMQLQNDLKFAANEIAFDPLNMGDGLMIQMPGSSSSQLANSFGMNAGSPTQPQGYFTNGQTGSGHPQGDRQQFLPRTRHVHSHPHPHPHPHPPIHPHPHPHHPLSASHPSQSHSRLPQLRKSRSNTLHYGQHRQQQQQRSPSHSQLHRRAVSYQQLNSQVHQDRNNPSDSDSPCPSPSIQVRKRKSTKSSCKSGGSGAVDFVNYTPSDSRKILTGVAPSGSSKTKARREKEALEKRRKLSQAAVRAVRAAGGDVESLVEQGLFV